MILNVLHRPDRRERLGLFEREQRFAHDNGLRTTIFMTAEAFDDPAAVDLARGHAARHGDEIGLSLHGLSHRSVAEIVGYGQEAVWLMSREHKRAVLGFLARRFREAFGAAPTSLASYHLDASTMALVREILPEVRVAVAGCFEEGVRVFHGCNNSWYLFNEGMPWGPWYPSRTHTLRPAADEADWCGVVAVPHLVRDMVLSYEGRNDFWASHPPNVMRGMGYDGERCPYDRNLVDMHRWQERWNDGYAYYTTFVSTAWLAEHHAVDDAPEVAQSLYRQQLEYLGGLKRGGAVVDMTLTGFADWFRDHRPIGTPEVFFAKELLYGSGKHYFWYLDPAQRVLVDATQGGSIGDLRPYVGHVAAETGPESPLLCYGSYPYLVHSQHRTGLPNHFQDGARSTAILEAGGASVDLATLPTRIVGVERGEDVVVRLEPVTVQLDGTAWKVQTTIAFERGGRIRFHRSIGAGPDDRRADGAEEGPGAAAPQLRLTERVKLAPGRTEYPESMEGIVLEVTGATACTLAYAYNGRVIRTEAARAARAVVPSVSTVVQLVPRDGRTWQAAAEEGHLFSPFVTLLLSRTARAGEESVVCLEMTHQ